MTFNHLHYIFRVLKTGFTPRKILNAVKLAVSYQLSFFGIKTRWKYLPWFISIEPVNGCNLHCPECPVGIRTERIEAVNIDEKMVYHLIDELEPTLSHVIFYFQGEPFMNRNFTNLVRYAHNKNLLTSTSTNAQLLTDETARKVVESGLDRLIVSIDGVTQETYEAYRTGGQLKKALQAVENMIKWRNKLKSRSPFIEIQFLVLKTNEHEMEAMKLLTKKLKADKLTFKSAQLYDFVNGNSLLPDNKRYARYELRPDGKYHLKNSQPNRCKRLWSGSVLTSRGDILPCCYDKDSSFVFGNLNEKPFGECFNSYKAAEFRKKILHNRKQFEMCRNCKEK
ncbi:MAG: Radical domain protein [Bacteroidetes bacterium]|nr:Radical domain protein [Bacteroidota bacterium]